MICELISNVFNLVLLGFFLVIPFTTHAQQPQDTLMQGESMNHSQFRVSPAGNFKLGFFNITVGTNSKSWYLGVWYNHVPVQTIVWVANRRKPLPETGGLLSLSSNGTLLLTDSAGALFWSSSVTGSTSSMSGVAQLLDSGNLVVSRVDGSYAWQSFDYPSDTLLPGMKLGWDLKSGLNRNLTAWKSPTDPSPGDYTMVMDRRGVPQVFVFTGTKAATTWRGGPWNGQRFTGVPEMRTYSMFKLNFIADRDEIVYTFNTTDPSVIARLVMNGTGKLQRVVWIGNLGAWSEFWFAPKDICDAVNSCGAFGVCDTDAFPACNCARGFHSKSPQEWYLRDGSDGCVRKTPLDCINGTDGFAVVSGAKLPDTSNATLLPDKTMTLDQCRAACLRNCSCTAYAAADITAGPAGSGCILWAGELTDLRTFGKGGQDLYLRVAQADLDKATSLDWSTRYQIIMGIARGLVYLHHDSRLRIVHRDLKASNILLDKDMIPKISDFGMARIFGADDIEENTQRVVGTYGYMSPEYAMDGVFSTKSDVFSFGVLVLEIISGKKNHGFYSSQSQLNLLSYVWSLWKEGNTLKLVDKSIGTIFPMMEVLKCIKIGLLCVQELPEDRPTMLSIVFMLEADSVAFQQPKQPGFTIIRGPFDASSSLEKHDSFIVNRINVTMVKGQ